MPRTTARVATRAAAGDDACCTSTWRRRDGQGAVASERQGAEAVSGGEHARELAAATLKPSRCPHAARLFGLHRSTRNASRRAQERMAPRALFAAPPEPQEGFWLAYDALSLALGSHSWPPVPQRA
eukprot:tig00021741_g23276.t1